jgi:tetratricopeptide (TPR) repeat protein
MQCRAYQIVGRRPMKAAIFLAVAAFVAVGIVLWERHRTTTEPIAHTLPPEIPSTLTDSEITAALQKTRELVLSSPQSGQAWGELGMVFLAHRFYTQSNFCFAEASCLDPKNPRWPYFIGLHYVQDGSKPAIPYLQKAYDLAAEPMHKSAARTRLAEAYLDSGELAEAEKLLGEEVNDNPRNPRAYHGLAVLAIRRGDYREAIAQLKAVPNPSVYHQIVSILACCHRQLGEIAEAERLERVAAGQIDAPWPDPFIAEYSQRLTGSANRLKMAADLQKQGRSREAAVIIEELVRANPDDQTLVLLGFNLLQLGQLRQAEQVMRTVLAKNANHTLAHDYLGLSLMFQAQLKLKAGDKVTAIPLLEEAVVEFRQAAKLNPTEGRSHLHAGDALKSLGKLSEAVDEYRAAALIIPDHAGTYVELGEVLLEMNQPTEAIPYLEAAIRLSGPNDRAKKLLEKAKNKGP